MTYISGWIVPVRHKIKHYPLNSTTLHIKTNSGRGKVVFFLSDVRRNLITIINISWWIDSWRYSIHHCTTGESLMFPVTPLAGDKKSWEVTITPEGLKDKM